jgi:hypothetical protein
MKHPFSHLYFTVLLALAALPAWAYLDPASGSMLLQLLLGGAAGVAVVVKLYWHKALKMVGVKKEEEGEEPPA